MGAFDEPPPTVALPNGKGKVTIRPNNRQRPHGPASVSLTLFGSFGGLLHAHAVPKPAVNADYNALVL